MTRPRHSSIETAKPSVKSGWYNAGMAVLAPEERAMAGIHETSADDSRKQQEEKRVVGQSVDELYLELSHAGGSIDSARIELVPDGETRVRVITQNNCSYLYLCESVEFGGDFRWVCWR